MRKISDFYRKIKNSLFNSRGKLIPLVIVLTILLLSVGYSAFNSKLTIHNIVATVYSEDIRVTDIKVMGTDTEKTCTLIGGNALMFGSQYSCDPGDGVKRNFYLVDSGGSTRLSTYDNNTHEYNSQLPIDKVALLMTENIDNSEVSWVTQSDFADDDLWGTGSTLDIEGNRTSKGPITAKSALRNKTTKWLNVEVSLPEYATLALQDDLYGEFLNLGNLPEFRTNWVYNNLNANGPKCYWTNTLHVANPYAIYINYTGSTGSGEVATTKCGLRPIIILPKSEIVVSNNSGSASNQNFGINNITSTINLPYSTSSVSFEVDITNYGNVEMAVASITGLPSNLTYELLNYEMEDKICNAGVCKLGITKKLHIKIKYKDGGYDSSNTNYNINLGFDFKPVYDVTYTNFNTVRYDYPLTVVDGKTLTVNFGDSAPDNLSITSNGEIITNYTYNNGVLIIDNVKGNVEINKASISTYEGS